MAFPVASTGAMQQEEATMAAYIVATVRISDPEKFALYGKAIAGLSERFGGVPVVKGPVAEVLEGGSPVGERVVVTRFETAEAAPAYIGSPDYRPAADRKSVASGKSVSVRVDHVGRRSLK